jgi:hypothetical protein
MLAAATRWLAGRSSRTLLVARRASAFDAGEPVVPIDADWRTPEFAERVREALERHGPPDTALLWLHEPGPTLSWLAPRLAFARAVIVLGSLDGRPKIPELAISAAWVRLGSLPTASGRRWLTHEEISLGAIASLQDGQSRTVGELRQAD